MVRKTHSVSCCGLTTVSRKTIKNTNNISIFNWIPRTSRGMTEVKRAMQQCLQSLAMTLNNINHSHENLSRQ
ncbi:hypothetical protein [Rickettsia tamurae]|uniref:hypothetical protein n=1 Tax=Rickettsia tamurae TaxID=334545 RepID=UPI001BFE77E1|nr:hypothetical protein [Rickettsia tamurae]